MSCISGFSLQSFCSFLQKVFLLQSGSRQTVEEQLNKNLLSGKYILKQFKSALKRFIQIKNILILLILVFSIKNPTFALPKSK
jgi:hypothetical protein